MANMLDAGTRWQLDRLKESASVAVIYRRGALSVGVDVTRGRSEYQTFDDEGNLIEEVTDADFIIAASELTLAGSIVEPQRGDTIEEVTSTGTRTYAVMPSGNRRPYALDQSGQFLRIHTKLVSKP